MRESSACLRLTRILSRWVRLILIGFLLVPSLSPAQDGLKKIRFAYPDNTICCLPLLAAYQWKFFEASGLQVEIIQGRSQIAYPALSSGQEWQAAYCVVGISKADLF